ncbi:hypothetical protein DFJ77DRAFT_443090 [Powellomyces hirtus]|nr:hypothetical protein DFJ77DRAFT_443090 [Powellomyces hirtus]
MTRFRSVAGVARCGAVEGDDMDVLGTGGAEAEVAEVEPEWGAESAAAAVVVAEVSGRTGIGVVDTEMQQENIVVGVVVVAVVTAAGVLETSPNVTVALFVAAEEEERADGTGADCDQYGYRTGGGGSGGGRAGAKEPPATAASGGKGPTSPSDGGTMVRGGSDFFFRRAEPERRDIKDGCSELFSMNEREDRRQGGRAILMTVIDSETVE